MTQPFHFPNGQLAYSAEDLLQLCQQFPDDGTNYLVREDLEKWLAYIGKDDIAQCAASARQTSQSDRQKLEDFLFKCHALSSPETQPKPEPSKVQQTPTIEAEPEPVTATAETTSVDTATQTPKPAASNSTKAKPSFFRTVARLVVNVLYRNKS